MNKFVGIGFGAAAALVFAVIVGLQVIGLDNTGVVPGPTGTSASPVAEPSAESTLSLRPSPAAEREEAHGWPSTRKNAAGTYSWRDGCAGANCIFGWMHNGYGSGDVAITIDYRTGSPTPSGEQVTVAGYDGIYRRVDSLTEEWIVDIEGSTVAITLTAEAGTSQADLDEAHAIIDSMRTEPTAAGFRILFTLATDDWDSG